MLNYQYDAVGNRRERQIDHDRDGVFDIVEDYMYDLSSHRLIGITVNDGSPDSLTYNDSGHLTEDTRHDANLSYNQAGRLSTQSSNLGEGSYVYNALGQRVVRIATTSTAVLMEHTHYGLRGQRLQLTANDGRILKSYIYLNDRLVWLFTDTLSADSDQDGLDDAWELQFFGDLNQSAASNYDGDAWLDGEEFAQGSDPAALTVIDHDRDGFSVDQGDWNDFDAAAYPGAVEVCNDGIDQNNSGKDSPCGDINGDGDLDIVDVLLASRQQLGLIQLTAGSVARGDLYPPGGDGVITLSDLLLQQQAILKP